MAMADRLRGRWPLTLLRRLFTRAGAQPDPEQRAVLQALGGGWHLKVHRTVDGAKVYRLHDGLRLGERCTPAEGSQELPAATVEFLERHGYLQSNMKFPAATLLLTERGRQAASAATSAAASAAAPTAAKTAGAALNPVGPHRY